MRTIIAAGVVALLAGAPVQSRAGEGQVAAGILGGLAAGTIIGSAMRPAPPPAYYYPAPVYAPPMQSYALTPCYTTLGRPVWDGYRGMWVRPQVQVCD
jgi:hypothetical protein